MLLYQVSAFPLLDNNKLINNKSDAEKKLHESIEKLLQSEYGDAYYKEDENIYVVAHENYWLDLENNQIKRKVFYLIYNRMKLKMIQYIQDY